MMSQSFTCFECGKSFNKKFNLRRHMRCSHTEPQVFQCDFCDKTFNYKSNLKRHRSSHTSNESFSCAKCLKDFKSQYTLKRHLKTHENNKRGYKCPLCGLTAVKAALISHYNHEHDLSVHTDVIHFNTHDAFLDWKNKIELENKSSYVVVRSQYKRKDGTSKVVYKCHRDGCFVRKGQKRHLKVLGTNKINAYCPSKMDVTINPSQVIVRFIKAHVGHSMDLGRLRISKQDKENLAQKIALKIPFETILKEVRESVSTESVSRTHLLTKKDLFNIEKLNNLEHQMERRTKKEGSVQGKWFDQLITLNKGKLSSKLNMIQKRHMSSLSLNMSCEPSEGVWHVSSRNEVYKVRQDSLSCECDLRCSECEICIHAYECSCPDSSERYNMCKHVHLVGRHLKDTRASSTQEYIICDQDEDALEVEYITIIDNLEENQASWSQNFETKKVQVLREMMALLDEAENMDDLNFIHNDIALLGRSLKAKKS